MVSDRGHPESGEIADVLWNMRLVGDPLLNHPSSFPGSPTSDIQLPLIPPPLKKGKNKTSLGHDGSPFGPPVGGPWPRNNGPEPERERSTRQARPEPEKGTSLPQTKPNETTWGLGVGGASRAILRRQALPHQLDHYPRDIVKEPHERGQPSRCDPRAKGPPCCRLTRSAHPSDLQERGYSFGR